MSPHEYRTLVQMVTLYIVHACISLIDYKSQANNKSLEPWAYLSDVYHEGYKIQMDFYGYLLSEMGHDVSATFYFLVCNANRKADGFFGKLEFEEVLVPYKWNAQWIPEKVSEMINCMNSEEIPESNVACKNCAYARQRININLDLF